MGTHTEDHNEHICAGVGHVIASVTVVRCGHRESWTITASTHHSPDGDNSRSVFSTSIQMGPFDTLSDIAGEAGLLLGRTISKAESVDLD